MKRTTPLPVRTCYCGREFLPRTRRDVFCSKVCNRRYHNARQRVLDGKAESVVAKPRPSSSPGMLLPRSGILNGSNPQTCRGGGPARPGAPSVVPGYGWVDSDLMERNSGGVRHAARIA